MKNALCRKPVKGQTLTRNLRKSVRASKVATETKPAIGASCSKKVISIMTPQKRIVTQKVVIFYDESHLPIWVSYDNKSLGTIFKTWLDYTSMSKIISIGRNRDLALSYACEIESRNGNKAVVTLRQYNQYKSDADNAFDCLFVKKLDLSFDQAVDLAINQGLGELFGYSKNKCRYKDGILINHPSREPKGLLKALAKRVHTVVRFNGKDRFLYVPMYGYEMKIYVDTNGADNYVKQQRLA